MGLKINEGDLVLPKTSGVGMKVDVTSPTFGWRDLKGLQIIDTAGASRPTLTVFQSGGAVKMLAFGVNDEQNYAFHIPHDWLPGSDCFLHVHWGHNGTAISGNVVFTMTYSYADRDDVFNAEQAETITFNTVDIATTPQHNQFVTEIQLSDTGGTGNFIDSDDITVDGEIIANLELTTLPTITGGDSVIFISYVDIHYQSTNVGTKNKSADFYA